MTPQLLTKPRDESVDLLRGVVIILMVLGHTERPELLKDFLSCFRMPLFVIVSGFFFKAREPFGVFFVKKLNRLVVPFMIYSFLNWLITLGIIAGWHPELMAKQLTRPVFILAGLEFNSALCSNLPLWFLTFLFSVSIVNFGIRKITRTHWQALLAAAVAAAAGTLLTRHISLAAVAERFGGNTTTLLLPYYLNGAMGACVLFWFGTLYFKVIRGWFAQLSKWQSVALMVACFGLYTLLFRYNCPPNTGTGFNPIDIRICAYGNNILLFYVLVALMFTAVTLACNLVGRIRIINYIGRNTNVVLIFNYPIKFLLYAAFPWIEPHWWLVTIIYVAASLPLIWLVNRYLPWTIGEKPIFKQEKVFSWLPFLRPKEVQAP